MLRFNRFVLMEYYRNNFKSRLKGYLNQRYSSPHIGDLNHDQCHEVLTVLNFYLRQTQHALKRKEIEAFIKEVSQQVSRSSQAIRLQ